MGALRKADTMCNVSALMMTKGALVFREQILAAVDGCLVHWPLLQLLHGSRMVWWQLSRKCMESLSEAGGAWVSDEHLYGDEIIQRGQTGKMERSKLAAPTVADSGQS